MRIAFNDRDTKPGDCKDIHSYDCFLNGKLFTQRWCLADEEKGEIKSFKRDENNKCMLNKSMTEPLRETFIGIVELKLKTRETR